MYIVEPNLKKIEERDRYTRKKRYLSTTSSIFFIRVWWKLFRYKKFFKDVLKGYELTKEQKIATISEEDRNLVIAGAGTGKTSLMIAKAGYLIKKRRVNLEEVLLLSFGREPREVLIDRGKEKLKLNLNAYTFHSYGKELCDEVYGDRKICKFDDREKKDSLTNFIYNKLKKIKKNDPLFVKLINYFSDYLVPPPDLEGDSFKTLNQYKNYITFIRKLTLNGEEVKSYGELRIANFLAKNGIHYEYEKEWSGVPLGKKYRPDFTAFYPHKPDQEITIEYFGVDREGNTKPGVLPKKYNSQMDSKKAFHKDNKTDFIALHYYDLQNNELETILSRELKKRGIKYKPISTENLIEKFNDQKYYSYFSDLCSTFLTQFKSNQYSIKDLKNKAEQDERSLAFLDIFTWILKEYEDELKKDDSYDFSDMINDGIEILDEGKAERKLKWIIVDEFQDISKGRTELINALIKQNPKAKLLVVGDDWQSIYRFAGSDINRVQKFEYFFNNSIELRLDRSFRFNSQINLFSQTFIMDKLYKRGSTVQIEKNIKVKEQVEPYKIYLHWKNKTGDKEKLSIVDIVRRIKKYSEKDKLLILSRYRHNFPDQDELKEIKKVWGNNFSHMTIHKAKGEEAEFIIITDLLGGSSSFPSERASDPLLNLVLAGVDKKDLEIKGEERRLFYVGVTRAKHEVHLVSDLSSPSSFVDEILEYKKIGYDFVKEWGDQEKISIECPECGGYVVNRKCSNNMFCDFIAPLCQVCSSQCMPESPDRFSCTNDGCNFYYNRCKEGDCIGQLIPKTPNHPDEESDIFLGCSEYNFGKCEKVENTSAAVCHKCGDGYLERKNRNVDNKPFISCTGYRNKTCKFASDFKNPIYENSYLVSDSWDSN